MEITETTYDKIKSEIENSLSELEKMEDDEQDKKNKDIIEKINYFNSLTDKIEDRRSKLHSFSYQYIVILITILGVLITYKSNFSKIDYITASICLSIQIFTAVFMIIWYYLQSSYRYPFLKIEGYSNQWKWFYYGNEHIQRINENPLSKKNVNESIESYLQGLKLLIDNYQTESLKSDLRNNIIQLYLLQVHNFYKNRFYLQLLNIRKWGFFIVMDIVIGYGLVKLILLI